MNLLVNCLIIAGLVYIAYDMNKRAQREEANRLERERQCFERMKEMKDQIIEHAVDAHTVRTIILELPSYNLICEAFGQVSADEIDQAVRLFMMKEISLEQFGEIVYTIVKPYREAREAKEKNESAANQE